MKAIQSATLFALLASRSVTNGFCSLNVGSRKYRIVDLPALPDGASSEVVLDDEASQGTRTSRRGIIGGGLSFLAASAVLSAPAMAAKVRNCSYAQSTT